MKCYGGFPGKCKEQAGTPWTPYWCTKCDEKRRARITANLNKLLEQYNVRAPGKGVGQ